MDRRTGALLGVPSSVAAHWPGQEKAPQAIREAGLSAASGAVGVDLIDAGDTTRRRGRPSRENPQNLDAVVAGLGEDLVGQGHRPFVVGGECSVELGVLAGQLRQRDGVAMLGFDGGADLRTAADNPTGLMIPALAAAFPASSRTFRGEGAG